MVVLSAFVSLGPELVHRLLQLHPLFVDLPKFYSKFSDFSALILSLQSQFSNGLLQKHRIRRRPGRVFLSALCQLDVRPLHQVAYALRQFAFAVGRTPLELMDLLILQMKLAFEFRD